MSEQTNQISLSSLRPAKGSKKSSKRLGRGSGSGLGKTSGKGHKGQKARSGASIPAGFEGGQMPLHRRLPKKGFTSPKQVRGVNLYSIFQLASLANLEEKEVTVAKLREKGLVSKKYPRVKIIGSATLDKAYTVEVDAISAGARAEIERAGGTVTIRS